MVRVVIGILSVWAVAVTHCAAEQAMKLHVIPQPAQAEMCGDGFELTAETVILVDEAAESVGEYLAEMLAPATGLELNVRTLSGDPIQQPVINLRLDSGADELGDEGYRLEIQALDVGIGEQAITEKRLTISAKAPAGLFYGCQTLRQLLPAEIDSPVVVKGVAWTVPGVVIEDKPRFAWRGLHLDVGRHFYDVAFIKRYLDLMARYKLNVFHWHLTEDQGWRVEVKGYPKLTEVGAWRTNENGERYGGFYTQDQVREVVAYAASRHITVVPEIEVPGHSTAALAAYPQLSCTGGPFEVSNTWGVHKEVYCAGNEATYAFLEAVLEELIPLFPSEYFHVGGDECPKDRWKACEKCQAKIKAVGLKDEHELQSYVIRHFDKFLAARGKKLVGWDEILEGGLAPGATVMSWRGDAGGIAAAKLGRDVVMSPYTHLYFDYTQSDEPGELGARYRDYAIPLKRVYEYEPIPDELTPQQARHILGAQGNVWTEPIKTPQQVEYMAYPRVLGLAEVVWSPKHGRDWDAFESRVIGEYKRLDLLDVNYRDHRE